MIEERADNIYRIGTPARRAGSRYIRWFKISSLSYEENGDILLGTINNCILGISKSELS